MMTDEARRPADQLPNDPLADFVAAGSHLAPNATIASLPDHPDLAIASLGDERWKIRRWPAALTADRLATIHATIAAVHASNPGLAPAVGASDHPTSAVVGGRIFDIQGWLPGRTICEPAAYRLGDGQWSPMPGVLADDELARVCAALAHAHLATETLVQAEIEAPSLGELQTAVNEAWKRQRSVLRPLATETPAVRRWLGVGERALPAAEAAIATASTSPSTSVVCHLALWPAHILTSDQDEVGFIGWEHAAVGSPLIDLAQVVARCRGWTAASAEAAIAAYSDVRPLRPEDRRLLPAVAAMELVASSGQLLIAAYSGRPGGSRPPTALRDGARQLLDSLDVVTNALQALSTTAKERKEQRQRPGGPGRRRTSAPSRKPRGPKKRR